MPTVLTELPALTEFPRIRWTRATHEILDRSCGW
jgi:hypothetical protein